MKNLILAGLLFLIVLSVGCGVATPVCLSGNWSLTLVAAGTTAGTPVPMSLSQAGSTISGTANGVAITGQLDGSALSGTIGSKNYRAVVTSSSMSGTYIDPFSSENGTLVATKVTGSI